MLHLDSVFAAVRIFWVKWYGTGWMGDRHCIIQPIFHRFAGAHWLHAAHSWMDNGETVSTCCGLGCALPVQETSSVGDAKGSTNGATISGLRNRTSTWLRHGPVSTGWRSVVYPTMARSSALWILEWVNLSALPRRSRGARPDAPHCCQRHCDLQG